MRKYTHTPNDNWYWAQAGGNDIEEMLELSLTHFKEEFENIIFSSNPNRFRYHLHKAILDQIFELDIELLSVARDKICNTLIAWHWSSKDDTPWCGDAMLCARIAHVDQTLSPKARTFIIGQQIEQWIAFATLHNMPIICSSSIRPIQGGFLKLHENYGFIVRGSYAYKRITL